MFFSLVKVSLNMKRFNNFDSTPAKRCRLDAAARASGSDFALRAATTHQGDARFQGNNSQCVAMSACAAVYSIAKSRDIDNRDMDFILEFGDALYLSAIANIPIHVESNYLLPEEIPSRILCGNIAAEIQNLNDNWLTNGLFKNGVLGLSTLIENEVFKPDHIDTIDSVIFTGNEYTVAFWRHNGTFYLFNSHAVDINNKYDRHGVARLFKCNSILELSRLLVANGQCNTRSNNEYSFYRLRVLNIREISPVALTQSPTYAEVLRRTPSTITLSSSGETVTKYDSQLTQSQLISDVKKNQVTRTHSSPVESITDCDSLSMISPSLLRGYLSLPTPIESINDRDSQLTPPLSQSILCGYESIVQSLNDSGLSQSQSILTQMIEPNKSKVVHNKQYVTTNQNTVVKVKEMPVVALQNMFSGLGVDNKEEIETSKNKSGRPKKVKRGRQKTKDNAHLEAVKKYNTKEKSKQVHREAVKKYATDNPKINQNAVAKYIVQKPDVHRKAVAKYTKKNLNVNRQAVTKYVQTNPNVHREAVQRYTEQHPEINLNASRTYNTLSRNVDVPLRRSTNLIGQKRDAELNSIKLFALKKTSLLTLETFRCPHCRARLFEEEKSRKQWCCGSGTYNVQNFAPLTENFYSDPSFQRSPRSYNNMFSFSAIGISSGLGYVQPEGLSFIKIQGRVYHRVFDLSYTGSVNNLGLYIHDPSEREQIAAGLNLNVQVIQCITHFLHNVNPYIECFKRLSREPSDEAYIQFQLTSRSTHGNILGDLPIGREVAAIISTDRESYVPRCIAVWKLGDRKPHTVDIMHPLYESFQYPLLYPEGSPGWYPNKLDNKGNKLTQNKYVKCLLLSEPRFSEIGRLSEEWLVDMFCRIIEERLRYFNSMQSHTSGNALRSAPLSEVEMSVGAQNDVRNDETIQGEGGVVPGRIYLPNTFTGGPRYMKTKYCDSIAIVNRLGNPSYFLTFTCNPKWPEIQQSTTGNFRNPLICARAFNLRLAELLRDLRSGRWFGKCIYLIHVIEFQKRGLPHAHICFRVEGGGPATNIDIDKFVRADIPDASEANGRLQKAVLDHMIHGPCGPPHRTNLPCWDIEKKKCSRFFPKPETTTTFSNDKGFINLRRDSKNKAVIQYRNQNITVNDTWVVPYNAALLLKYDAHINLEVSTQRTVVKYLFKYISKGPDESRVAIVPDDQRNNEIEQYVTKRYVGSSDAAWRTLEFDVTAREPAVKMLSVHLENQQTVYFKPGTEAEAAKRAGSDLITYFNRPIGIDFDRLTYLDFYENYIIHSKRPSIKNTEILQTQNGKFITKRLRGELVARLFWVAPNRGEQFYLRILLKFHPCRSYADLIHLGGPNCKTFQEAAKIVGLADDEIEYERAMLEASSFFTGPRLRSFFVLLAVNGVPVASLWENYKNQLSEDISFRLGNGDNEERAHSLCLIQISRMLRKHGSSLLQHGLPDVIDNSTELGRERVEYNHVLLENEVDERIPNLSRDQRTIFDYIVKLCTDINFCVVNDSAIFIDGPAGTGKTYLLDLVTSYIRGNLKGVVLCTASSAIAAQNYKGGCTAHSMFKFPIDLIDDLGYWNITNGSQRAELIFNADLIIYDEAPMAHKYLVHLLDRSLQDLMKCNKIFGGKIIIFAGDFRQIPPVVTNAKTNSDILNSSVKTSPLWKKIKSFSLVTSHRCHDVAYSEFILNLGSNRLPTVNLSRNLQNFVDLSDIDVVSELEELIDFVFPFVDEPGACIQRAILCSHNEAVKEINNIILDRLQGDIEHFFSIDKIDNDNADELFFGPDTLNSLQPKGIPEHDLKLKIGCICMIMRNLSFSDGLVNGTKVIVTETSPRLIKVQKCNSSDEFLIPRILFKAPISNNSPFEMCRRQFPLQLCYAMTIHKSQGQTIARVGVDLRSDMFSHGQLYVALGRVTAKEYIKILIHKDRILNGKPYAKNVIIPELIV